MFCVLAGSLNLKELLISVSACGGRGAIREAGHGPTLATEEHPKACGNMKRCEDLNAD